MDNNFGHGHILFHAIIFCTIVFTKDNGNCTGRKGIAFAIKEAMCCRYDPLRCNQRTATQIRTGTHHCLPGPGPNRGRLSPNNFGFPLGWRGGDCLREERLWKNPTEKQQLHERG